MFHAFGLKIIEKTDALWVPPGEGKRHPHRCRGGYPTKGYPHFPHGRNDWVYLRHYKSMGAPTYTCNYCGKNLKEELASRAWVVAGKLEYFSDQQPFVVGYLIPAACASKEEE